MFKSAEDALGDRAGPVHPDDRPGPRPGGPGDGPPGPRATATSTSGTYEGWYCPNEGFRNATDVVETARGTICPNHPDVPLQWLTERNWFFRLSAYQERLERHFADHPDFVQPDYRRNEMLGFIRGGLEDFSISRERTPGDWGIPFPIAENGETALREDGSWDPEAGKIYVWYDALINYITGAGFPDDPEAFAHWWPADLHVIGKDIARFHTIFWPAMLWSAGLEAPRHVWVHGWLLAAGGERMSKSRGNFLDPDDFVAALRAGRRALRRSCARCRSIATPRCRWDSFVRRYNADLANDFGNLVNRTVSMTNRYLDGERPAPRAAGDSPLAERLGGDARARTASGSTAASCTTRWPSCGTFVGAANKIVDAEQPWELAKAGQGRRRARRRRGCAASWATSSRRAGWSAWRSRRSCPATAPRVLAQLGYAYPYAPDGNGGPPILDELGWGAHAGEAGRVARPGAALPAARRRARGRRRLSPRVPAASRRPTRPAYDARVRLVDSHCHLNADRFEGDADLVVGGARLAGVERILVPGWNVASSERALDLRRAVRLARRRGRRPSARRGQGRRRRLGADRRLGGRPAGRRDRRDRARLRPRLQPDPGPADQPAAEPRARARDRQAGHPPLPLGGGPARRPGRPARGAPRGRGRRSARGRPPSATGRRRSSTRSRARSTTRGRSSTSGSRSASRASSSGAARKPPARSPRSCPADRLLVETDSPFLAPPGAPRSRNEPEWVRVTAAWLAERRGTDARGARRRPRRRLRPDLPESTEDMRDPSRSGVRLAVAVAARGRRRLLRARLRRAPSPVASAVASASRRRRRPRAPRRPSRDAAERSAPRQRSRAASRGPPPPRPVDGRAAQAMPQTVRLPSDRFTVDRGLPGRRRRSSSRSSSATARCPARRRRRSGTLDVAKPPFTEAASGDADRPSPASTSSRSGSAACRSQNDVGRAHLRRPRPSIRAAAPGPQASWSCTTSPRASSAGTSATTGPAA